MTIKEFKEKFAGQFVDVEVYAFKSRNKTLSTDHVDSIDDYSEDEQIDIVFSELMDENKYNETIYANCDGADFAEWYDDSDAKILVLILEETKDERINRLAE